MSGTGPLDNSNAITQGIVKANGYLDIDDFRRRATNADKPGYYTFRGNLTDEDLGCQKAEVLLTRNIVPHFYDYNPSKKEGPLTRKATPYVPIIDDGYLKVYSAVNSLSVPLPAGYESGAPARETYEWFRFKDAVERKFRFAGLMASPYVDYRKSGGQQLNILPYQFGGVNTMYNSSNETIFSGDGVVWELPFDERKTPVGGISMNKQIVLTKPFNLSRYLSERGYDANNLSVADYHNITNFYRSKVIGIAMTTAVPGGRFDIYLGRYF